MLWGVFVIYNVLNIVILIFFCENFEDSVFVFVGVGLLLEFLLVELFLLGYQYVVDNYVGGQVDVFLQVFVFDELYLVDIVFFGLFGQVFVVGFEFVYQQFVQCGLVQLDFVGGDFVYVQLWLVVGYEVFEQFVGYFQVFLEFFLVFFGVFVEYCQCMFVFVGGKYFEVNIVFF